MNEAESPPWKDSSAPNGVGGHQPWDRSRGSDEMMPESNETPTPTPPQDRQQQQHPYPTQQPSVPNHYSQTNNYSNDNDAIPTHRSLTPFRPMQPREFSLGSNLKRVHPAMPMPTLPADISGAISAAKTAKSKVQSGGASSSRSGASKLGDILGSLSSSDVNVPTKRASIYSRRSSAAGQSTMGRISEEENSKSSSGMSSGFSETLTQNGDGDNGLAAEGEIVGDAIVSDTIVSLLLRDDEGSQSSHEESIEKLIEHAKADTAGTSQEMAISQESNDGYDKNNLPGDYAGFPPESSGQQRSNNTENDDEDHQSEYSDSSGSFLSWDTSRRSAAYMQAMEEWGDPSNQRQQQHQQYLESCIQPQQQQIVAQTNSYESHPSHQQQQYQQQQQSHPAQYSTPTTSNNESYNRKVSQESCESMSQHSPTPFRPMLPRELLLGNNLRRLNPTMPFPSLPADASSGTAAGIARRLASSKGM